MAVCIPCLFLAVLWVVCKCDISWPYSLVVAVVAAVVCPRKIRLLILMLGLITTYIVCVCVPIRHMTSKQRRIDVNATS